MCALPSTSLAQSAVAGREYDEIILCNVERHPSFCREKYYPDKTVANRVQQLINDKVCGFFVQVCNYAVKKTLTSLDRFFVKRAATYVTEAKKQKKRENP